MKKTLFALVICLFASAFSELSAQEADAPVAGAIFDDVNKDGERGAQEAAVVGAVVSLIPVGAEDSLLTVTTGADGSFAFDDVPPGDYQLQITFPSGLIVKGEAFTVTADGEPQFFAVPAINRVSAARFTNYTLVNPANTKGDVVSPFAP